MTSNRPSRAAWAGILALTTLLAACATPPSSRSASGADSARSAVNREIAKTQMRDRLADDDFWERTLNLPRSHPRFPALRTAMQQSMGTEDMLDWWLMAGETAQKYPGVTVGALYVRFVNNGLLRLNDRQAEDYLRSRASVMERLDASQCAQFFDNKLPNREVWSLAATLSDAEIIDYYRLERVAFEADLKRQPVRSIPSKEQIGDVHAELKRRFPTAAISAGTARCQRTADWLKSFEGFPAAKRQAAMTVLLTTLSTPAGTASPNRPQPKSTVDTDKKT